MNHSSPVALAIVIPVKDRPDQLLEAVRSVVGQGSNEVQIVIVDDGSDPAVDEQDFLLRDARAILVRTTGVGAGAARNAGVEAATARWVSFLDSDDLLLSGSIAEIHRLICAEFSVVVGAGIRVDDHGTQWPLAPPTPTQHDPTSLGPLLAGTFAVERSLFCEVGGYRPGLRFGENTELGLRLGLAMSRGRANVATTSAVLVRVNSRERTYDAQLMYESGVAILDDLEPVWRVNRKLQATYQGIAGVAAYRLGMRDDSLRLLSQAWRNDRANWRQAGRLVRTACFGRNR
jgi:glycosyltransferase involved in cell wall biosynthesis